MNMRAAVITRPGGPEVLEVLERPTPEPKAGEILVRVHASALNRADLLQRAGQYPAPPGAPQDIPGMEFAGEVAALGAGVTTWRLGDRVFGITPGGGNAEYVVSDAGAAAPIPDTLSWIDAAAIPEAFITAYDALVTQAAVRAGERVLIHAVGSGVGLAAVQLGATVRCRSVRHCSHRGQNRTRTRVWIGGWRRRRRTTSTCIPPAASDGPVGRESTSRSTWWRAPISRRAFVRAALRGRIMIIGTVAGREATIPAGMVLGKRLTLRGTALRTRSLDEKRAVTAAFVRDVVPHFASGKLRATVDQVFALDEIAAAHERLASNRTFGKVVLRVAAEWIAELTTVSPRGRIAEKPGDEGLGDAVVERLVAAERVAGILDVVLDLARVGAAVRRVRAGHAAVVVEQPAVRRPGRHGAGVGLNVLFEYINTVFQVRRIHARSLPNLALSDLSQIFGYTCISPTAPTFDIAPLTNVAFSVSITPNTTAGGTPSRYASRTA